jgi:hypothetical protein
MMIAFVNAASIHGQKMNIEVDTQAKAYAVDSVRIDALVAKVYALIANINDWPQWFEGVTEAHINGNAGEGNEFVWKAKGFRIKSKIHTLNPNSDIGWTGKMWWIKAIHNWHFESTPGGGTLVIVQESFSGLGASLMKNSLRKYMKTDLTLLRKQSEK